MINKRIANTYNFFEIDTDNQRAIFWGLDTSTRLIPLTEKILDLAKKLNLPLNEEVYPFGETTNASGKNQFGNSLHLKIY